MALRNVFGDLGLDSTLQAIRDRLPAALGGSGGVKVEQQGSLPSGSNTIGGVKVVDSAGGNQATVSAGGALKVDGSAATQPVSGTVTANQGGIWDIRNVSGTVSLPTGAATSTKQSDGSQKTQVVDGSGNVVGSTGNALDINIKSGGTAAGTQYAEGATAATATGTLAMGKSGTTLKAAQTDSSGNLRVDLSQTSANATAIKVDGSAVTQPVNTAQVNGITVQTGTGTAGTGTQRVAVASDSSITANAGTNLNTSALALDATLTGGNQQTKITDGTNIVSVLKSDGTAAGQNSQLVASGYLSVPFTTTTAQAVGTTDVGNYRWVSVQITSQGGSSTVTWQESNDNSNWVGATLLQPISQVGSLNLNTTATGIFHGPISARYFRLNITGITSGTTAGTIIFSTTSSGVQNGGTVVGSGTFTVAGNKTNNNAAPGATNAGVLPAIANAAAQSWTEGNQVLLSTDLSGNLRTSASQAATVSNVGSYAMTDAIFNGTTSLTPKFATIVASASGATTVVAAVGGKRIRVMQVVLIANAAVNVKFQSHVTPTDITGLFYLAGNSGFSSGFSSVGQFQTVSGEALDINLSGAVAVGGYLTYVEV